MHRSQGLVSSSKSLSRKLCEYSIGSETVSKLQEILELKQEVYKEMVVVWESLAIKSLPFSPISRRFILTFHKDHRSHHFRFREKIVSDPSRQSLLNKKEGMKEGHFIRCAVRVLQWVLQYGLHGNWRPFSFTITLSFLFFTVFSPKSHKVVSSCNETWVTRVSCVFYDEDYDCLSVI